MLAIQPYHPVQGLVSRTGSFPLDVASRLLGTYARAGSIVFDPFCGKGTTLLAARLRGLPAYGMDVAPEAVVCTAAKMVDVNLRDFTAYIQGLRLDRPRSLSGTPAPVLAFFHRRTLSQILNVRDDLLRDIQAENRNAADAIFALATLLGILHGHASYSLSLPCAHAYSMAPAYVAKYAKKHKLQKPIRDVAACLIEKATRCLRMPLPDPVTHRVVRGSVVRATTILPELVGRVDVILTSPPYFNAQTYAKDNWLRLWLLGHDFRALQHDYVETGSLDKYERCMKAAFGELFQILKPGGRLICIAGDVRLRRRGGKRKFKTGLFLANLCEEEEIGFTVEHTETDAVASNEKYLHAISMTNGHSERNLVERLFVARKPLRKVAS